jgi:predicted Rossmann fold flavoprotein
MAAWRAAELGAKVILLEKTERVGTKILISGGGKCNICHDGMMEDILRQFPANEARFIRPSCYRWTNDQIVDFLTTRGLDVYTRPDGCIFPVDQTAKDVVRILHETLTLIGVDIIFETPVLAIQHDKGQLTGVKTPNGVIETKRVILAAGGSSYPKTGTTGDGWPWAKELGHTIVPVRAALAPIVLHEKRWTKYSGVAVRDCVLRAKQNGKEVTHWLGDVLFTHQGISGPTTLGISREVCEAMQNGRVNIEIDLEPDKSWDEVRVEIQKLGKKRADKQIGPYLERYVARSLVGELAASAGLTGGIEWGRLSNADLQVLAERLKAWPLGNAQEVLLNKGEVVAGGISLDEVDPQTMESRKCQGLYCCGEVLDVAGPVGGYNLQAAFSTGYVAGESTDEATI